MVVDISLLLDDVDASIRRRLPTGSVYASTLQAILLKKVDYAKHFLSFILRGGCGKKMSRIKIAIPTKGDQGLEDYISDVFSRAEKFTVVDVEDGSIIKVKVVDNPAKTYEHGAGPIVVNMLTDIGVTAVGSKMFGVGVSALLEHNGIKMFNLESRTTVKEAVQKIIESIQSYK
ncbi:hypothetical protein CW706_00610 [Candidatus Bathyarchaeota archaeon]|nr:MAG: hypothetical protein CW706_00610 [Candidatus Bathyarchaeota archaeon]